MSADQIAAATEVNRTPVPAPIPPENPGRNATDSQGVRKYDAEDVKSHGLDPKADKKKSRTAPRSAHKAIASTGTPVNDLRLISASLSTSEVTHATQNLFIPSFGMMFNFLDIMNDKVCSLRPYSDNGFVNNWIPQVSNLYFSVLAIVQCLRAQEMAGVLSYEQAQFLKFFTGTFALELFEIPGPLVPFFRSLSVSSPGFGNYQDVFPAIPVIDQHEEHMYNLDFTPQGYEHAFEGLTFMVPNIPLMYDQLVHLIKYVRSAGVPNPNRYSTYEQLRRLFDSPAPTAAAEPRFRHYARLRKSIGFWHRPTASDGLMARFANYVYNAAHRFPAPWTYNAEHAAVAANATADPPVVARDATWVSNNHWSAMMMMNERTDWFALLHQGMHSFTSHWKGNMRMIDIHPTSSAAGLILFKQVHIETIPRTTIFGANSLNYATHYMSYNTSSETTCPYILTEDYEDAKIAQVNVICPDVITHDMRIGDQEITRYGEFWDVSPAVMTTPRGNLVPQFQAMIASSVFFTD